VKLLVRAHDLKRKLIQGSWDSLLEFARAEGLNDSYATRPLTLAYLTLSIVDTILDGRQPPELSAIRLMRRPSADGLARAARAAWLCMNGTALTQPGNSASQRDRGHRSPTAAIRRRPAPR
jgi:hypothetical protein